VFIIANKNTKKTTKKVKNKPNTAKKNTNKKIRKIETLSGEKIYLSEAVPVISLSPSIFQLVKKTFPKINKKDFISRKELKQFKKEYLEGLVKRGSKKVSNLQKEVIDSLLQDETISENADEMIDKKRTRGEIISDKIADYAGSWTFIISFFVFLFLWMLVNSYIVLAKPFDPYPFILLNLALSTLAAVQAPLILMSQNRKEARDRLRAESDYKINLKSELEIRFLHEKLDHLSKSQWKELLDLEKAQVDLIEDIQDDVDDELYLLKKKSNNSKK